MANLKFSADIIEHVLFEAGEKTDGTSDYDARALIWLNANYKKIWQGGSEFDPEINEDWTWLREKGSLILQIKIATGTVSVTNDSATATLSASQAVDVADWFFKVDDYEGIFRIATHGGSTDVLTLDSVYTGNTNATASYKLVKLDYTLASDAIEILTPMYTAHRANRWFGANDKINGVSLQSMPEPYVLRAGIPYFFTQINETTVRFDRYADSDLLRIDYRYKKRPVDLTDSGSEEPLVPLHHRHVLASMTLFDLFKAKNDDRSDQEALIAKQGLKAMSVENKNRLSQMDNDYGRIHPRNDLRLYGRMYSYRGEPYS